MRSHSRVRLFSLPPDQVHVRWAAPISVTGARLAHRVALLRARDKVNVEAACRSSPSCEASHTDAVSLVSLAGCRLPEAVATWLTESHAGLRVFFILTSEKMCICHPLFFSSLLIGGARANLDSVPCPLAHGEAVSACARISHRVAGYRVDAAAACPGVARESNANAGERVSGNQ